MLPSLRAAAALGLPLWLGLAAAQSVCARELHAAPSFRAAQVIERMLRTACVALDASPLGRRAAVDRPACRAAGIGARAGPRVRGPKLLPVGASVRSVQRGAAIQDGLLLARRRLAALDSVALDFVAYLSSGLIVGGLLCYIDDDQPRTAVIHLHGGFGGIFLNPDGGDIVATCYRWAAEHGRTAFVPSFRGQDGGQGWPSLCRGAARDVAAGAVMLRQLTVTDPERVALIGASMGGCVALWAGTLIPDLRAVVAIAPPTHWQELVAYHRANNGPATEIRCDGSERVWDHGGVEFADTVDRLICGHLGCSEAQYQAESPIPSAVDAPNPTLVVVAGADNLVPPGQQALWSVLREEAAGPIEVVIFDRCAEPVAPPLARDVLLYVPDAYHLLEDNAIFSALTYLVDLLDAPDTSVAGLH